MFYGQADRKMAETLENRVELALGDALAVEGNHPMSDGELGQAGNRVDVQAAHDTLTVGFDGADADAQLTGDLFIALALGDENQNFTFAIGKLAEGLFFASARDNLVQGRSRDIRAEERLTFGNRFDCLEQFLGRRFFGNITMSAGLNDAENVFTVVVNRQPFRWPTPEASRPPGGPKRAILPRASGATRVRS